MKTITAVSLVRWTRCLVVPLGEGRSMSHKPQAMPANPAAGEKVDEADEADETSKTLIKLPGLLSSHRSNRGES